jgi:hypothetical protein
VSEKTTHFGTPRAQLPRGVRAVPRLGNEAPSSCSQSASQNPKFDVYWHAPSKEGAPSDDASFEVDTFYVHFIVGAFSKLASLLLAWIPIPRFGPNAFRENHRLF